MWRQRLLVSIIFLMVAIHAVRVPLANGRDFTYALARAMLSPDVWCLAVGVWLTFARNTIGLLVIFCVQLLYIVSSILWLFIRSDNRNTVWFYLVTSSVFALLVMKEYMMTRKDAENSDALRGDEY